MAAAERCVCKQKLVDGGRLLTAAVEINWGADDARADWAGERKFCSFKCLASWAAEKAVEHDGRTVV